MRDLICDVIIYCALSCDTEKISVNDKILTEHTTKDIWKSNDYFYINFNLKGIVWE